MLTSGSHQYITFTYDDALGRINSTFDISAFNGVQSGQSYNINVIGDDSSTIVNALNRTVSAPGGLIGPLFTNLIDSSDSSPITVTPAIVFDSNVTVGGDIVLNNLLSVISNVPGETAVSLRTGTNDSNALIMSFAKSRGTTASPTSVLTDDQLGSIGWAGYSSSSFLTSGAIVGSATGTITALKVPGKIEIFTTGDTNGLLVRNALFSTADGNEFSAPTTFTTDTYSASSAVVFGQHHSTVDGRNTSFIRSRGTQAAPTTVVSGDDIAEITFQGHDGTAYRAGMVWSIVADGAPASSTVPMSWVISTNTGSGFQTRITIFSNGDLSSTRAIRTSGLGGIGYTTGAGGTGSQTSAKTDTVTINKPTGEITTANSALASDTNVTFTLSNTAIVAGDHVIVSHISGGTLGAYNVCAIAAAGSATITIRNITVGSLTEALVIKFTVIKSVTA
jgi:hypothetical protein